jgi:hypothetical protein
MFDSNLVDRLVHSLWGVSAKLMNHVILLIYQFRLTKFLICRSLLWLLCSYTGFTKFSNIMSSSHSYDQVSSSINER